MVPLRFLHDWAVKHRPAMVAARKKFVEKERTAVTLQKRSTTRKRDTAHGSQAEWLRVMSGHGVRN
jgi:hypothetical protein